jgi:hypothetical protein
MTFQSFLRLFGERRPAPVKRRKHRSTRRPSRLRVECLENRELLSVVPPHIIMVTPTDGSPLQGAHPIGSGPTLSVTFDQNVVASDATNVNNYLLFGSHNNPISVDSAFYSFNPGKSQGVVTLTYHDPATNPANDKTQGLVTDTYTLFIRAANIHSALDGVTPVTQPGQLAVANAGSSNVSLVNITSQMLANGTPGPQDGTLQAITNYPVGFQVDAVQVASVLGTGRPDLIAVTERQVLQANNTIVTLSQVVIIPGVVGGGFSTDTSTYKHLSGFPNNARPGGMVVTDLNGDGVPDIAITDSRLINGTPLGTNDVTIFLSTPGGNFAPGVPRPAGNNPIALVATSIRDNGFTDLVAANGAVDNGGFADINLLFNNGDGTFQNNVQDSLGLTIPVATDMVLADPRALAPELRGKVVNDNATFPDRADLVVSTRGGVIVLQNDATPLGGASSDFIPASPLLRLNGATPPPIAVSVAIGNFTGHTDGFLDIAATDGHDIYVFADVGGSFNPTAVRIPVGASNITKIVARQVNGQSGVAADIIAIDSSTSQAIVLLNTSINHLVSFAAPSFYRVGANPLGVTVSDASGDGALDIITANAGSEDVSVLRGTGTGTFVASTDQGLPSGPPPNRLTANPTAIAVGDLNNDGLPDIVITDARNNQVDVLLRNASGGYNSPLAYQVGQDPVALGLGDITGDGFEDIVVANQLDNTLTLLINNGDGTFHVEVDPSTGNPFLLKTGVSPTGIALGDFSNNGSMDIAVSHLGSGSIGRGVSVFMSVQNISTGRPSGFFTGPTEYANSINASAITAADFNHDGILDLAVLDNQASGHVAILQGLGDGTFVQTGLFNAGPFPSALAVGDLNRDGFPDLVISDNSNGPNFGTGSIAVLLNASGNGFNAPTFINSPLFTAPFQSIIITDVNQDLYPDIVVSTHSSDNNLFTLLGIGDGSFQPPRGPYAVSGGDSAPSYVALVSDPFVRVTTFTTSGFLVGPELLENGTFDSLSLSNNGTAPEKGNLNGWNTFSEQNSAGQWGPQTGTLSPQSAQQVPAPPQGSYAAMLDQPQVYNVTPFAGGPSQMSTDGTHVLYQDIVISPSAQLVRLTFKLFIDNTAASIPPTGVNAYSDTSLNPSLDYILSQNSNSPNQQVRIDVIDPTANLLTTSSGVLQTIFQTSSPTLFGNDPSKRAGAPALGYMNIQDILAGELLGYNANPTLLANQATLEEQTTLDLTGLKSPTQDRTVRLRIATANTDGRLIVGVDNLQVTEVYKDAEAPVVTGLQLRNPGFGSSAAFGGNTTDPTLTGQVFDAGGPQNVAYVLVDTQFNQPGHTNFQVGPGVYRVSTFDAQGHFQTTLPLNLPSQVINGQVVPTLIGVEAVSKGNDNATGQPLSSSQSISFVNQGPNTGAWQAMGPGPISTTGLGLDYQTVSGRVTSVVVDPRDTSGNVIYVGTANGGVWKTVDGGVDWTPLTDNLTNASGQPVFDPIGALAIDPANPSTLYAATGVADHAYDSQPGTGVYKSTDAGKTWTQLVNPTGKINYFVGARISTITVSRPEEDGLTRIYVAVEAGGQFGPGLYRSVDGGQTWVNTLNPALMFLHAGGTLGVTDKVTSVASVTDVVIDRLAHEDHDLIIGIGNTGFVSPTIGNAGISAGLWQSPDNGNTWFQWTGGTNPFVLNDTLPTGAAVGRITLAIPETQVQADGVVYALISDATPFGTTGATADGGNTRGSAIADNQGNTDLSGLYKSKNGGSDWTHVMLRQSVPIQGNVHNFLNLELTANEGSYVGALAVDPANANVVYLGGARIEASIPPQPGTTAPPPPQRALLRIDTSDMRDTSYHDPFSRSTITDITNDGDDINKVLQAGLSRTYSTLQGGGGYVGEGVYWQDLEQNTSGASDVDHTYLPPFIHALTFDPQGRLLVGTDGGIWRGVNYGFGYDFSSSAGAILSGRPLAPTTGMVFTSLNGNLQISDTTSVAIDPSNPNVLYSANAGTGWALTNGSLTWSSMGPTPNLFSGAVNSTLDPAKKVLQLHPGVVRVASVDPTIAQEVENGNFGSTVNPLTGIPTTIYLTKSLTAIRQFNTIGDADQFLASVLQSTDGGLNFQGVDTGIRPGDPRIEAPSLAVDPQKIFVASPTNPTTGAFEDLLLFGTVRVYRSENSTVSWIEDSPSFNELITATAVGPASNQVFYAGTNQGHVFVTLNNGSDGFPSRSTGLPLGTPINNITVDPTNSLIAYAMVGGTSNGHVFRTTNGGVSWQNISSNLPNVPAFSLAIDPRAFPDTPSGRLYVGTQVGVYTSVNLGASWQRLGSGLPNVPVLDIAFSQQFEKLVVGTLGRGVFQISTDRIGPRALGATPGLPSNPGVSSVRITFDSAVDPRTFLPSSISSFVGPNGPITVLAIKDLDPATHQVFEIDFSPQITDGTYSLTLAPTITDLSGNLLNQNGNFINGENPQDSFNFQFAINGSDNGRFITGTYHDLLGRPADTSGFIGLLSAVDIARFQNLGSLALSVVSSGEARGDLIDNFNNGTGYYPKFLHRTAAPAEVANWVQALNQGAPPEQIVAAIVGSDEYFNQVSIGGVDTTFIHQLYLDLLSRPADSSGLAFFGQQLSQAEQAARNAAANGLDHSGEYRTDLINLAYTKFLGRTPSPTEVGIWLNNFQNGLTDESFFAALASSNEYFARHGGNNASWISALYTDILNRPADPTGTAALMAQLQAGTPRGTVAMELLTSGEYRQDLVQTDYNRYLGRNADPGGLSFFVGQLQQGMTDEAIVSTLVSSGEFFTKHGGSGSLGTMDQGWIGAAYQSILGRPADSTGTAILTGNLAQAERTARASVVQAIVSSTEYKTNFITTVYQKFLGRLPASAEINQWLGVLNGPSPGAGKPNVDEVFEAAVLGSQEYFSLQKDSQLHTSNELWLTSLYNNLLGRAPDAGGFNVLLNNLLTGYQPQRLNVETAIVKSNEFLQDRITAIYQQILRRAPTATELSQELQAFKLGTTTDETLIAQLVSSNEYFTNPNLGANNNSTWLNQVFVDLLGRDIVSADPGAQSLLAGLNNGGTRISVALVIVGSMEYRDRLIKLFYNTYLKRAPSATELTFWETHPSTDENILAAILASNEYFLLPHTYP